MAEDPAPMRSSKRAATPFRGADLRNGSAPGRNGSTVCQKPNGGDTTRIAEQIRRLRRELAALKREIYSNLDPWQTVQVSRHQTRPQTRDYIELIFEQFVELHGDRAMGDDQAIVTGLAHLDDLKVMFIGHQKGKNLADRKACHFGCAHPEGYRKALKKMQIAAKFGLPIISFIDTPGAYPGITAEERGQAAIIAENLMAMSQIRSPIVCVVIGEGGSGGAWESASATAWQCSSSRITR